MARTRGKGKCRHLRWGSTWFMVTGEEEGELGEKPISSSRPARERGCPASIWKPLEGCRQGLTVLSVLSK